MHDVARRLAFVSFLLLAACPSEEADPSESNDASSAPGDADAATATDGDGSEAFDTTPPEVDLEIEFTRVTPGSSQSPVGGFVLGDPGEIFASRASETVERSTDGGRSWETRAIGYMVVASDRRGRVYGFKRTPAPENEPSVSMDDGATFTKLSLPFVPTRQVLMFVTSDGALWVQENVESAPYRSADHGAHFNPVPLPTELVEGTTWWLHAANDGYLYARRYNGQRLARTRDGAEWETLAAFSAPGVVNPVFAGTGGTIIAVTRATGSAPKVWRSSDGGQQWDELPAEETSQVDQYTTFLERPGGGFVRVSGGGVVDESDDDGLTWSNRVQRRPDFSIGGVVALDDLLLATSSDGVVALRGDADAWEVETEATFAFDSAADLVDIAFAGERVVLAGRERLFVSADGGTRWKGGRRFALGEPVTAVAMRPDGQRIFVGSTLARYRLLDGDASQEDIGGGRIEGQADMIRQADWSWTGGAPSRPGEYLILVTTANDDDTSGALLSTTPELSSQWDHHFVLGGNDTTGAQTVGYHGVAIARGEMGNDAVLVVAARRWLNTNSWLHQIRARLNKDDPFIDHDVHHPIASSASPLTISAAGAWGQTIAWLFPDDRLFLGWIAIRPAVCRNVSGAYRAAKFAPDGHLWLVTSAGVFRSTASVRELAAP